MKEVIFMMKYEFEQLAGYEVTDEMYDKVIEPMYMSADVPKQEFVKMLNKKYFALPTMAEALSEMKAKAREIHDACGHRTTYDEELQLQKMADVFCARFYNSVAYLNKETAPNGCSFVRSIEAYSPIHEVTADTIILI